jgi:hypothetical protein
MLMAASGSLVGEASAAAWAGVVGDWHPVASISASAAIAAAAACLFPRASTMPPQPVFPEVVGGRRRTSVTAALPVVHLIKPWRR